VGGGGAGGRGGGGRGGAGGGTAQNDSAAPSEWVRQGQRRRIKGASDGGRRCGRRGADGSDAATLRRTPGQPRIRRWRRPTQAVSVEQSAGSSAAQTPALPAPNCAAVAVRGRSRSRSKSAQPSQQGWPAARYRRRLLRAAGNTGIAAVRPQVASGSPAPTPASPQTHKLSTRTGQVFLRRRRAKHRWNIPPPGQTTSGGIPDAPAPVKLRRAIRTNPATPSRRQVPKAPVPTNPGSPPASDSGATPPSPARTTSDSSVSAARIGVATAAGERRNSAGAQSRGLRRRRQVEQVQVRRALEKQGTGAPQSASVRRRRKHPRGLQGPHRHVVEATAKPSSSSAGTPGVSSPGQRRPIPRTPRSSPGIAQAAGSPSAGSGSRQRGQANKNPGHEQSTLAGTGQWTIWQQGARHSAAQGRRPFVGGWTIAVTWENGRPHPSAGAP